MVEDLSIPANPPAAKKRLSWVSVLLLLALGGEIALLVSNVRIIDLVKTPDATGQPMAKLMAARNRVRTQSSGDLVWNDAREGETLFRRQSVLTSAGSGAEIAFLDGTGIVLDENSMVQIEKNANTASGGPDIVIRLLHGSLHKNRNARSAGRQPVRAIEIRVNRSSAEISQDGEVTISTGPEATSAAKIEVQNGSVKVRGVSGGELTVSKGEEATVPDPSSGKTPTARTIAFTPISPKLGATVLPGSVKFAWDNAGVSGPMELEVASDPDFRSLLASARIAASEPPLKHIDETLDLKDTGGDPHSLYWRVRGVESGAISSIEHFILQPVARPKPIFPPEGAHAEIGAPVSFSWEKVAGADGYELQIGSAPSLQSNSPFLRTAALPAGKSQWRARARFSGGSLSPWSDPRTLTIEPKEKTLLPPPDELEVPKITPVTRKK